MNTISIPNGAPLHDGVVDRLRQMIVRCELRPGERISERELGEVFGVSRTPLREALKILASEGLIEIRLHRGSVVAPVSSIAIEQAFEVIGALERFAAPLVCDRISNKDIAGLGDMLDEMDSEHDSIARDRYFDLNVRFHKTIVALSGNAVLAASYADVFAKVERARHLANDDQARWDEAVREHRGIVAAMRTRDGTALGQRLVDHNSRTRVAVLARLRELGSTA